MSTWFDQSNNANKLRQSYLKGFLDISGGGILVRSDNSLNFYKSDSAATPNFALDATKLRVPNITATAGGRKKNAAVTNYLPVDASAITGDFVDISSSQLSYLHGLSENVQATIDEFHAYKTAQSSSATIAELTSGNASITNDATIGGRLFVGGDAGFGGSVSISKELYVGGNVVVGGDQTVNMDLYVKGNTHLDGDVWVGKELRVVNANLFVQKNITASGEIISTGNTYVKKDISVAGETDLCGNLRVAGDASFNKNLSVYGTIFCDKIVIGTDVSDNGTMHIGQKLTAGNDVEVAGILTVGGDASFNSKLYAAGAATLGNTLSVTGAATLSSTLGVTGAATLSSTLGVTGATTLSSTLGVTGATTLSSTLGVTGAATLGNTLSVTGAATLSSTLGVTGATTLSDTLGVTGAATLSSTLGVTGATTLSSTLGVTGDATLSNKLLLSGDASMNSKLFVSGDASMNSKLNVGQEATVGLLQTGRIIIEDNYSNNANVPNTIRTTSGNIRIAPAQNTDWTVITSNLQVDGSINFTGAMVRTDTIVKVTEAFDVSNSGTRTALVVSQYAPSQNIASFDRGDETDPVFTVGRDNCAGINIAGGSLSALWNFDVSGATRISKALQVNGDVEFTKELSVAGNIAVSKALSVTKAVTIGETLDVTGAATFNATSTFVGNVLLNSHLKMDASKFIDQVGVETW